MAYKYVVIIDQEYCRFSETRKRAIAMAKEYLQERLGRWAQVARITDAYCNGYAELVRCGERPEKPIPICRIGPEEVAASERQCSRCMYYDTSDASCVGGFFGEDYRCPNDSCVRFVPTQSVESSTRKRSRAIHHP